MIARAEKQFEALEELWQKHRRDYERLEIAADRAGVLFPPTEVPAAIDEEQLSSWSGRPLDLANLGCALERGQALGSIADPRRWEASIVLDQEDVQFVEVGDAADIILDALPGRTFHGIVDEVALGELRTAPRRLSAKAGGELSTTTEFDGERPVAASYHVRVRFEDPTESLRVGWRGTARIHVRPLSLSARIWRSFSRTFHFDL